MDITPIEPQTQESMPWHKPQVARLVVNMDTLGGEKQALKFGSFVDGADFPTISPPDLAN